MVTFFFFFFGLKRQFRDIVQQQSPSLIFYLHYTFLYRIKQSIFLSFIYAPTHILFKTKFIQIYVLPSLNLFLHNLEPVKAKHFLFGLIFISHENHPLISCPRQKKIKIMIPPPIVFISSLYRTKHRFYLTEYLFLMKTTHSYPVPDKKF